MKQSELVAEIAKSTGATQKDVNAVLKELAGIITKKIKGGDRIAIAGLGAFSSTVRAARTGRNPSTGAAIQIPAQRVPKFKASKTLKDAMK